MEKMIQDTTKYKVVERRLLNPCATLEQIGREVGVTKERVRQILKKYNQPTKHFVQRYLCLNCGSVLPTKNKYSPPLFCNKKCRYEYAHPLMECEVCGILVRRNVKRMIWENLHNPLRTGEHIFCGKKCHGIWFGRNYGLGRSKQ